MTNQPTNRTETVKLPKLDLDENSNAEHEAKSESVRIIDKRWWAKDSKASDADSGTRSDKPSYVQDLENQVAEKDKILRDYATKYKAAAKEIDETRLRVKKEISKDIEREKRNLLTAFLEVIDNLDRAIQSGSEDSALLKGVELVRQQFLSVLNGYNVSPLKVIGEVFDPSLHDAISTTPVSDITQDNIVLTMIKPGYHVGKDVLRPATVTVGKHNPS